MTTGRTHDARFMFDTGSALVELNNVLGLTLDGDTTTSRESYLGQEFEQASVHAAGGGVSFSTVISTDDFDSSVFASASTPNTDTDLAIICPVAPLSFQLLPVAWARPSWAAPEAGAVTRPWSLLRSGRGMYGTRVTGFTASAGSARTIVSNFGPANGSQAAIVITGIGGAPSAIALSGRADVPVYGSAALRRAGIRKFPVASGAAAALRMTVTGANTSVRGFVLQGEQEVVANG